MVLAPKSLLAVRRLASQQRRWARDMSGVTIVTPYRPRPVEVTNGLIGRLQRCKWLLTDPATWRDLLWMLVNGPAGVVLGLLPAFMVVCGVWILVVDGGTLLYGWWNVAPPGVLLQVFFLSMLPLGVITSAPVESAVYFAVAEALANVVKHSGANRAWVQLEYSHGRLVAIVGDNGTGGAALRAGGGLRGVEQRLAAFDGVIAVTSPDGGPTLVTMELPCELSLART